jgi:hypothetical protein
MFVKNIADQIAKLYVVALFPNLLFAQTGVKSPVLSGNENIDQFLWSFSKNKSLPNQKRLIDFNAIENWRGLGDYLSVSNNGEYFAYTINKPTGTRYWFRRQDSLIIQGTKSKWRKAFATSKQGFFSADDKQYIFQNGSSLFLLGLGTQQITELKDVNDFKRNTKTNCLAYRVKGKDSLILHDLAAGKEKIFDNIAGFDFDKNGKWLVCKNSANELVLYNLLTRAEKKFPHAVDYAFSADGENLIVKTNQNLQYISLPSGELKIAWSTKEKTVIGNYGMDATGKQVVFTILDTTDATNNTIGYYNQGMGKAVVKISGKISSIPEGLTIRDASFSDNNHYIKLSLQSSPDVIKADENMVGVEVWNHKDLNLQSAQTGQFDQPTNFNALVNIKDGKLVLLENSDKEMFLIQGDFAVVKKDYESTHGDRFWETREDSFWLVSLKDGNSHLLPTKSNSFWFSPSGDWLVYFDAGKGCNYFSYDLNSGLVKCISANVPENQLGIVNSQNDQYPKSGCLAAWVEQDEALLVYDNFNIWKLDLTGKQPAKNITNGVGLSNSIIFNLFTTDRYSNPPIVKPNETLILRGYNIKTKESGFYKKNGIKVGPPVELYMGSYFMKEISGIQDGNVTYISGTAPVKAKDVNSWVVQRQSTNDAANYWETTDFKNFRRLTDFQPQKHYQWFTEEVVYFKYLDGKTGQGILYKPENFDPSRRYPVLIPFYGGFSGNMYQFPNPTYLNQAMETGKSPIWFLNNGYIVFTPDIAVAPLKYGPKAFSVIEGAVQYLKQLPFVDGNKIGCATHSWSAKLGSYVFTHSKSIAATAITEGFVYANVINHSLSSRGGKSRLEDVEIEQEYGSLWDNKNRWLDQTTVLNVDRANSPLLLLCNKESLPDYQDQTFQLFNALRRLDKNVWWLNYENANHTIEDLKERKDYTIRYTQFFDHYLKYAPAPQWMTQGIPLKLKGVESRYELDPQGKCNSDRGEPCPICEAWNKQYKRTPAILRNEIKDWALADDIAGELERKINERRKELDKQGEIQTKQVMEMLNK